MAESNDSSDAELVLPELTMVDRARYAAIAAHGAQSYAGLPYYYHLELVARVLRHFGFDSEEMLAAGYLHDAIEDTALSYHDIEELTSRRVAEAVYAVTDELGRDRAERKKKTYGKIRANPDAVILKIADRLANVLQSRRADSREHLEMYAREHETFLKEVYVEGTCDEMVAYLNRLLLGASSTP